jgi:hypothetical protein
MDCVYDPVFRGISPGYGCNVAIEVRGPLATSDRVNVAHGRAERAGAVAPRVFALQSEMNEEKAQIMLC